MLRKVGINEAVGLVLGHDITKVVPGGFKGPAFRRGHIIRQEDIQGFLDIGKEHVFVISLEDGEIHEEEAAIRIAQAVAGPGLTLSKPKEGRVNLVAEKLGIVKIDLPVLNEINMIGEIIVATMHNNTVCDEGKTIAGMRIIPLYIGEQKLAKLEDIARRHQPVIGLLPLKAKRVGLIVTGNEVFKGRIKDGFSPIIHKKVKALGCNVNNETVVPDDSDLIARAILDFQSKGSEVILCCSGMSVDPDDVTPEGIRKSGAQVQFYGLPVLPGAMFLYAKLADVPVLGLPACVLYDPTTAFDLLFPRLLAGEDLSFENTRELGHGSLCLKCEICTYPVCPFGK
jgi:hypothetical protein